MSSDKEQKRLCKGICKQYREERPKDGNRYANGQVRCQVCEIYMTKEGCKDSQGNQATEQTEDLRCKCCNYKVRSKPRNRVCKEKYYQKIQKDSEPIETGALDVEELKNIILEENKPQTNYQYVVIKTLLQNRTWTTKDKIPEALEHYNKDNPTQNYKNSIVFSVLEDKGVIFQENNGYRLNITKDLDPFDHLEIISLCNQKIYQNKIKQKVQYYIALGPWEHWNHTIENLPLRWGVADTTPSNIAVFDGLSEGDIVFYYSTKDEPAYFADRGFFGVGVVSKKEINQNEKYWPIEKKTDKALYTHKLFIDTLKFIQSDEDLIPITNGLPLVKGLNHIREGAPLNELIANTEAKWGVNLQPRKPTLVVNHWKIAPGEQAQNWEEQKNAGVIAVGWNELGDLTGRTFEEVHAELRRLWPSSIAVFSPQFRDFLSIKEGDIIIANKGQKAVVGIGRVSGPYKYRPDLQMHHTYPIDWFDIEEREIPNQGVTWRKTIYPVSIELFEKIKSGNFPGVQEELNPEFEELIKKFDKDRYCFKEDWNTKYFSEEERNQIREEFASKFPRNKIKDLTLKEYALNTKDPETGASDKNNFSYLLESKVEGFGSIWGVSALKFGVFFKEELQDFWYNSKYSSADEAFEAVKNQIIQTLDAGDSFQKDQDWKKLSDVIDDRTIFDIYINVRSKILSVYYPNTFLSIHGVEYVDKILDFFKIPRKRLKDKLTLKQGKLIELKNSHPTMKNWTTEDYSYFLWNTIAIGEPPTTEEKPEVEVEEELPEIKPLTLPTKQELEKIKQEVNASLLIEDSVIDRIIASLYAGKNVLLTGSVGTGKTDLAQKIPKIVWNYYPEIHTATSDWTTQDVIGGLFPKLDNGEVKFKIQKGCVSSTVSKNWLDKTGLGGIRQPYRYLNPDTNKTEEYNGVWLVIDEFNRANIDRAFGQLFTALEYKNELKIPTEKTEKETGGEFFERYIIPDDYRIIGTLNTYDKHFLFHLSDALKRRFDFIEINPPSRKNRDKEIAVIHQKAADNESLEKELQELSKSNEKTDEKLYEIMSVIRKSKQLGTALMISVFKDMLIYHKMGQSWDESLDSALVKKIIPQLESLQVSTLGTIKRFVSGDIANFYANLSHDEHSEKIDDYAKDLEAYRKYYYERFDKTFSKNWINEFRNNNLFKLRKDQNRNQEQITDYSNLIKELNPWNEDLKIPKLPFFKLSLENLIEEKEYTSVNSLESSLN